MLNAELLAEVRRRSPRFFSEFGPLVAILEHLKPNIMQKAGKGLNIVNNYIRLDNSLI